MSNVTVNFDTGKAIAKRQAMLARNQVALDIQIVKDGNLFCPEDDGTLQRSAPIHSIPGSGEARWKTPYARNQYYDLPNKSKDKNPRAQGKWFEVAKTQFMRVRWLPIAAKGIGL